MKKKKFIIMTSVAVVFILVVIGVVIFSEKVFKLPLIEHIKNIIAERITEEYNTDDNTNATIVDVTGLIIGEETEHEHIYKTMYDDTKHWEECIACGNRRNEVLHNLKTTWLSGSETCFEQTMAVKVCSCGYSIKWHKPCVWDGKSYYSSYQSKVHMRKCRVCSGRIYDDYYLNSYGNGSLHDVKFDTNHVDPNHIMQEKCYKEDGTEITCSNWGRCVVCGYNYTNVNHYFNAAQYAQDNNEDIPYQNGKIFCYNCKKEFGTYTNTISIDSNAPATYTVVTDLKLTNGATFKSTGAMRAVGISWQTNTQTITKINANRTEITLTTKAKFPTTYKDGYFSNVNFEIYADNVVGSIMLPISEDSIIYPDLVEPVILSINTGTDLIAEWDKSKTIVVSGSENYCNTVKVEILDDENNIIYSGSTEVSSGKYSISCTPELEASDEGRIFKAIVTDSCENKTEQEFTISKIDAIAPEVLSGNEIGGDWAKEKNFTFVATDRGIGNVQIGFNDVEDYRLADKNGSEYSRDYKFIGDVYEKTEARVFYKDELGNISTQVITIDKIDNTAPTIVSASVHNDRLNIVANDEKEGLGEGSGIVKYRYITSREKIDNPVVTDSAIEVSSDKQVKIDDIVNVKYVYIIAEDLVRKCK